MLNSKILQEYRKERKRVQQLVRRYEKRGYIFDKELVPDIPKKITQGSIRRLKKITPEKVFESAFGWVEKRTGEVLTAIQGRAKERAATRAKQSEAAKTRAELRKIGTVVDFPNEVDIILDATISYIEQDIPLSWIEDRRRVLKDILRGSILRSGAKAVAQRISKDVYRLQTCIDRALTTSDPARANMAIAEFAEILKGDNLTTQEEEEIARIFEGDIDSEFYE